MKISSWGKLSREHQPFIELTDRRALAEQLQSPGIAFGMGRSYGDACLNPDGNVWLTRRLDRFINFSPETGRLRCEAGVTLRDIQQLFMPRGWMLPVTPGTLWVTVGGAIANDVHGKNHHRFGTFGHHINEIVLRRTDGQIIRCSATENSDWFKATIGGIGLCGLIVEAELQLRQINSQWLDTETLTYSGWDEFESLSADKGEQWEHTVSWFDCREAKSFRGVFLSASPCNNTVSPPPRKMKKFPFEPPLSLINSASLMLLNNTYYWSKHLQSSHRCCDYESFLFPLDAIDKWNRVYGPQGFYQYQCVIPFQHARDAIKDMLACISTHRQGSFLAVLKTFGDIPSRGYLSFPQPGVTLALDFPNRQEKTLALFARLDEIVARAQGKLYLAKDARMSRTMFELTYPDFYRILPFRDPGIHSAMSKRLLGH